MLPSNSPHNNKNITSTDLTIIPRNIKVGAGTDVVVVVTVDVVAVVALGIHKDTKIDMNRVITEAKAATMDIMKITTETVVEVMDMGINIDS